MKWEEIEGAWHQLKGEAKKQWGLLTDDDLKEVGGNKDKLIGKLEQRYGWAKERAEQEYTKWKAARLQKQEQEQRRKAG